MKKIMIISVCLTLFSSMALAAPLTDFSPGKTAIDVNIFPNSDFKDKSTNGTTRTYDAKSFTGYGLTVGLGNDFAFQYNKADIDSKNWKESGVTKLDGDEDIKTQEFNILRKVNEHLIIFTGFQRVRHNVNFYTVDNIFKKPGSYPGSSKTYWQVGLTPYTNIARNVVAYTTMAGGTDMYYWKAGFGLQLDKHVDLNIFYNKSKFTNLNHHPAFDAFPGAATDSVTISGLGCSLTCKL